MYMGESFAMLDSTTKFHRNLYVSGWFHNPSAPLEAVRLRCADVMFVDARVGLIHHGVATLGTGKGFSIQAMMNREHFPHDAVVEFQTGGNWVEAPLRDLVEERLSADTSMRLETAFMTRLRELPYRPKILDIGGRDRSKLDRSKQFPFADVTVLDILPGDNVDVVGDAHELSAVLPPESFDAIYSVSVFEHLFMPWKAAIEINKILKPGGVGLIFTHQTLGMHDEPWDFWRFSMHSWDALFNGHTGFRIVDRTQSMLTYILPMMYRIDKAEAEKAAGFEASVVMIEKTADTQMEWNVPLRDVINTSYPSSQH